MKRLRFGQPTTEFMPGHGFISRFGEELVDWEKVSEPAATDVDEYEINLRYRRHPTTRRG